MLRIRRVTAVLVTALCLAGTPAHAAEGGTIVGGANANPADLVTAGSHEYDGAFTFAGVVNNNQILATDCSFTAHETSPDGISADGTLQASGCAGDQVTGTISYHRTAGALTGTGSATINGSGRGGITIVCVIWGPSAYASVGFPPLRVRAFVGFGFWCTVIITIP